MSVNAHLNIDQAGLEFISRWEGCILKVYRDICNLKTVGVGHLITKAEDAHYPDGMPITHEFAMQLLQHDVQQCVSAIHANIQQPLNQNQFNALCSFAFNCGVGVTKNSGVAKAINAGNYAGVRDALLQWAKCKVNGVVQINKGLYNRRRSEADLFERPCPVPEEVHPVLTAEEQEHIQAQLDESSKLNYSYANLACSEHHEDAEAHELHMSVA